MFKQDLNIANNVLRMRTEPTPAGNNDPEAAVATQPESTAKTYAKNALFAMNTVLRVASTGIGLASGFLLFNSADESHQKLGLSSVILNSLEGAMLILEAQRLIVGSHAASTFRVSALSGASAAIATASSIMLGLKSNTQSQATGLYTAAAVAAADGLVSVIDHGARLLGHNPQTQLFGHTD